MRIRKREKKTKKKKHIFSFLSIHFVWRKTPTTTNVTQNISKKRKSVLPHAWKMLYIFFKKIYFALYGRRAEVGA